MRSIPKWFKKELSLLDPALRIIYEQSINRFLILKDLDYIVGKERRRETFIRASFENLNDKALNNLRYRQWLGREYMGRSGAYVRWLKEEEQEAKVKIREEAIDMITTGLMKGYKLETSKTFS